MERPTNTSTALVRKRTDTDLIPPPPQVKRIKRPKKILDEDDYTDGISKIIARDFFPGLEAMEAQHEYLDALDSKDRTWISTADRQLRDAMTPGRHTSPAPSTAFGGQTPSASRAQTPGPVPRSVLEKKIKVDANMSLGKFQATYTSEDNESFYKLVDKQNQKKVEKSSWIWNGNKLPSKQMVKQKEVEERRAFEGLPALEEKGTDDRPARPDSWVVKPKNQLMFMPDGVDDDFPNPSLEAAAHKKIVYQNTRMPAPTIPPRPPSPTLSAVRDAVHGKVREQFRTDSDIGGDETPRVNGYAFVDDEDDEDDEADAGKPLPVIDLGPGDGTPNPFKIQEKRKRESLHHKMVERISQSKRESTKNGFTGKVERTPAPKFLSSPRVSGGLTPAAQRLLSRVGNATPKSSGFASSTPARTPGTRLRTVTRARDNDT